MLPSCKAPPAGVTLVVSGNKAWFGGCASLLPVKQAIGTAGSVVLAVDGKRTAARLRSVVVGAAAGRDYDFSDEDLKPKLKALSEKIKKVAEETFSLLREVCVPKDDTSSDSEQMYPYFSKELEGLQKVCDWMMDQVGEGNLNEDVAITMLIGIHARLRLLLTENKNVEDFLLSSMYETKMSVSDYMSAQNPMLKAFSAEKIKKMAKKTSSMMLDVCAPKDSTFPEQVSFSKKLEVLQKVCNQIMDNVGEGGLDEDVAITVLIEVQKNLRLLLTGNKKIEDLLLSSMHQTERSVNNYVSAQNYKRNASYAPLSRASFFDMINVSGLVQPTPTVCSEEEVKTVLQKTLALLDGLDATQLTARMAVLFYGIRKNCRALVEEVEKKGVGDKTGSGIMLIHASVLAILGLDKKDFSYDDAADDYLLGSLRRLEIALQDYKVEDLKTLPTLPSSHDLA